MEKSVSHRGSIWSISKILPYFMVYLFLKDICVCLLDRLLIIKVHKLHTPSTFIYLNCIPVHDSANKIFHEECSRPIKKGR